MDPLTPDPEPVAIRYEAPIPEPSPDCWGGCGAPVQRDGGQVYVAVALLVEQAGENPGEVIVLQDVTVGYVHVGCVGPGLTVNLAGAVPDA